MARVNISISIDSDLKDKAQSVFGAFGLDLQTVINILLQKAIYQQENPLSIYKEIPVLSQKKDRRAAFGCLKGAVYVPDDFNEPLDDFKEYMH